MALDIRYDSPAISRSVQVDINARGGWNIELSGDAKPFTCETFEDAQRLAYLWAAGRSPCELIVHDAYHRVVHREFVNRTDSSGSGRQRR